MKKCVLKIFCLTFRWTNSTCMLKTNILIIVIAVLSMNFFVTSAHAGDFSGAARQEYARILAEVHTKFSLLKDGPRQIKELDMAMESIYDFYEQSYQKWRTLLGYSDENVEKNARQDTYNYVRPKIQAALKRYNFGAAYDLYGQTDGDMNDDPESLQFNNEIKNSFEQTFAAYTRLVSCHACNVA